MDARLAPASGAPFMVAFMTFLRAEERKPVTTAGESTRRSENLTVETLEPKVADTNSESFVRCSSVSSSSSGASWPSRSSRPGSKSSSGESMATIFLPLYSCAGWPAHVTTHLYVHGDELVNVLVEQEDVALPALEGLHVGAGEGSVAVGGAEVVDVFLVLLHRADVVVERGQLAGLALRGLVPEELQQLLAVRAVFVRLVEDALLEVVVVLVVELPELLGVARALVLQELEDALHDGVGELLDQLAVLDELAADVERDVLAVDDALDEEEPLGNNRVSRLLYQYFPT
ncbi:CoA transferase [Babesia caballi]|uniref:CoA transferase n=1 Tax=Babesia caballi TaxID=5871 RepID=A0AAV4LSP7_BABCB|nr:CoA transferase [Babesia caballi]